jgi:predicted RNase H-like HicB family nuclease
MKTYIFEVALHREEDGRWSAWIEVLSGCAAWGNNREEALGAIKDAAEAYVEDMLDAGEELL